MFKAIQNALAELSYSAMNPQLPEPTANRQLMLWKLFYTILGLGIRAFIFQYVWNTTLSKMFKITNKISFTQAFVLVLFALSIFK